MHLDKKQSTSRLGFNMFSSINARSECPSLSHTLF